MNIKRKYQYVDSEPVKHLAVMPLLIQMCRNDDRIYLYNLLMTALVYCENKRSFRPITLVELYKCFQGFRQTAANVLKYCIEKGLIEDVRPNNGAKRGRTAKHMYVCTLKGELLLKKYEKMLNELSEIY